MYISCWCGLSGISWLRKQWMALKLEHPVPKCLDLTTNPESTTPLFFFFSKCYCLQDTLQSCQFFKQNFAPQIIKLCFFPAVVILLIADHPSKELLTEYKVPLEHIKPFHQYHLELVQVRGNISFSVLILLGWWQALNIFHSSEVISPSTLKDLPSGVHGCHWQGYNVFVHVYNDSLTMGLVFLGIHLALGPFSFQIGAVVRDWCYAAQNYYCVPKI